MLRVDAALASSQQRSTTLVLDAFVNGDGLAAEATKPDAKPCPSCRHAYGRRHLCSAGAPRAGTPQYASASSVRAAGLRLRSVAGHREPVGWNAERAWEESLRVQRPQAPDGVTKGSIDLVLRSCARLATEKMDSPCLSPII